MKDPEREGGQWKEAIDQETSGSVLMTRGRWFTADSNTLVVAILISFPYARNEAVTKMNRKDHFQFIN